MKNKSIVLFVVLLMCLSAIIITPSDFKVKANPGEGKIDLDNEMIYNITYDLSQIIYTSYEGYDFRLAIRYNLGVNDSMLTVIPYIKNLGDDIPYVLGFGWELKDIQIGNDIYNDYIFTNLTEYWLNQSLNLTFDEVVDGHFHLIDDSTQEFLYMGWRDNLTYRLRIKSRVGQYNAPVSLFIRIGTLDSGQVKQTSLVWHDAESDSQVNMSTDDAHQDRSQSPIFLTSQLLKVGREMDFPDVNIFDSAFRFMDLNITRGSTIHSAFLKLYNCKPYSSKGGQYIKINISGIAEDNTSTFGINGSENPFVRDKTLSCVKWDIAVPKIPQIWGWSYTPNITGIVQEVVNRSGWSSGNSIGFTLVENDGALFHLNIRSYDWNSMYAAMLEVNFTPNPRPESKIENIGSTDIRGCVGIQIQFNDSGSWVVVNDTVNETVPSTLYVGEYLKLDQFFNGKANTSDLVNGSGMYRVYAVFRDPEGNVLLNVDESLMVAWYDFEVDLT